MNYLWFGKSLPDAIAAPILFVDGRTVIKGEPGFDEVHDNDKTYKQPSRVRPHLCSDSSSSSSSSGPSRMCCRLWSPWVTSVKRQ